MDQEAQERAAVVRAAREWLRTPFQHHAACKGAGVDCANLLLEAHVGAGLIERFAPEFYTCDWMMHRSEEKFLAKIEEYAQRVGKGELPISERGPDFRVLPGNVLIWRHGRTFSHGAIVSFWPMIIHASHPAGCCLEESVMGGKLERMPLRIYSLWGS